MDEIAVHIRVSERSWAMNKEKAQEIADRILEEYPELNVYIIDVEEP